EARKEDPIVAAAMNDTRKLVASKSLHSVLWENTELIKGDLATEVMRLKQQPGKDIAVFGSSSMAVTLIDNDLIDEFHIVVNPIVLGGGKTLFKGLNHRLFLKLIETRTFKNGNVLLIYNPIRKEVS
ncbi:dihydrofolate reductase, partial [bacterium]|nr:dihydrofolate reductase [bacterium]